MCVYLSICLTSGEFGVSLELDASVPIRTLHDPYAILESNAIVLQEQGREGQKNPKSWAVSTEYIGRSLDATLDATLDAAKTLAGAALCKISISKH